MIKTYSLLPANRWINFRPTSISNFLRSSILQALVGSCSLPAAIFMDHARPGPTTIKATQGIRCVRVTRAPHQVFVSTLNSWHPKDRACECCDKLGACGCCPVALQQGESRKLRDHRRQADAEAAHNHHGNQKSHHCIHLVLSENVGPEETPSP